MSREIWTAPRGKSHIVDMDAWPTVLCGAGGYITVGGRWIRGGPVRQWYNDSLWMEGERCKHCDALLKCEKEDPTKDKV
jgi:hypothetical protein